MGGSAGSGSPVSGDLGMGDMNAIANKTARAKAPANAAPQPGPVAPATTSGGYMTPVTPSPPVSVSAPPPPTGYIMPVTPPPIPDNAKLGDYLNQGDSPLGVY